MNLIKKKVSLIGTNGLPANYGGFETLVKYLANEGRKSAIFKYS